MIHAKDGTDGHDFTNVEEGLDRPRCDVLGSDGLTSPGAVA